MKNGKGTDKFVRGTARKQVARPEPPHKDRRTKRERTREVQNQKAIDEYEGPWHD